MYIRQCKCSYANEDYYEFNVIDKKKMQACLYNNIVFFIPKRKMWKN